MGSPDDHLDDEEVSDGPGRPASAIWLRVAAVIPAILLVFVVGRAWLSDDNAVHADGEGILSAQPGPGAVAFARPTGKDEFWGTFGTYFLCLDEDAGDVELTGFSYESTIAPRDLHLGIRTLTPRQVAVHTRGDATISAVGSTRGRPPQFRVHGRTEPLAGSFRRGIGASRSRPVATASPTSAPRRWPRRCRSSWSLPGPERRAPTSPTWRSTTRPTAAPTRCGSTRTSRSADPGSRSAIPPRLSPC